MNTHSTDKRSPKGFSTWENGDWGLALGNLTGCCRQQLIWDLICCCIFPNPLQRSTAHQERNSMAMRMLYCTVPLLRCSIFGICACNRLFLKIYQNIKVALGPKCFANILLPTGVLKVLNHTYVISMQVLKLFYQQDTSDKHCSLDTFGATAAIYTCLPCMARPFNEVVECKISNKLAQSPATSKIVNISQNL